MPPASPFLAHLFHLLYTFKGLLLSLANSPLAPVRFLILPSRRGENKNYESARHLSRATARSRGFTRPCSRASRHVSTTAKMFNPCVVRHETTTCGFFKYFEPMVSIFSRILDSQLYQAPVRIIGLQANDENLVSITFVQYYRVKFIIVFL